MPIMLDETIDSKPSEYFDISEYITLDPQLVQDESSSSDETIFSSSTYIYHQDPLLSVFSMPYPSVMGCVHSDHYNENHIPLDGLFCTTEYPVVDESLFISNHELLEVPTTMASPMTPPASTDSPLTPSPFPDPDTIEELSKTIDGDELIKRLWSQDMYGRKFENGRNWYCCHICQKLFTRSVNLKSHVVADHWKLRPIKCPVAKCNARFARKHDCKRHIRLVHHDYDD
jgi:hypothetical protein